MLKAQTGYSYNQNSFSSGVETATKATTGLTTPKLGLLFTSSAYNNEEVVKGVSSVLKNVPFIGATSAEGIILPDGLIYAETGFSGMLVLDDPNTVIGVAGMENNGKPRETAYKVALMAINNAHMKTRPSYVYLIATTGDEEEYLKGIQDVVGRVPIFGGTASDDNRKMNWRIFCNNQVFQEGLVVAFIYTTKKVSLEFTGAYQQKGNAGVITEIDGKTLVSIDRVPALNKYAEWNRATVAELAKENIFLASVKRPLGIKTPTGELILVRQPIFANSDNTIEMSNKIATNTAIISLEANTPEFMNGARAALNVVKLRLGRKAGAYLLTHSLGRKIAIGNMTAELQSYLKQEAANVPFIVWFSSTEFGFSGHSANYSGALMLSFAGISEE